jgi:hypothetical protein
VRTIRKWGTTEFEAEEEIIIITKTKRRYRNRIIDGCYEYFKQKDKEVGKD